MEQAVDEQSAISTGGVAAAPPSGGIGSHSDTGSLSDDGDESVETLQKKAFTYFASNSTE